MRERDDMADAGPLEVGLDDLLGGPRPAAAPVPAKRDAALRGWQRWLLGRVFFAIALGAVCYGLLFLTRWLVPYPLLVVTIFVITLIKYGLDEVAACPLPTQLTGRRGRGRGRGARGSGTPVPGEPRDGVALAVGAWEARLRLGERRGSRSSGAVLSRLCELVDERLRLRHGFTRASDPGRARQLMGEPLWTMLQESTSGVRAPREMAPLVTRIEQL